MKSYQEVMIEKYADELAEALRTDLNKACKILTKIFQGTTGAEFQDLYDGKMTRYHICGIGYDKNNCVTDYETNLGDFDDYEEAYQEFVKLQCEDVKEFFQRVPNIYKILIQLEECEETDEEITCIDVNNEWWITNPNYKEEA